jgi:hypothetical protein
LRHRVLAAAVSALAAAPLAGCGKQASDEHEALGFEFDSTADSASLARGRAILTEFEPYRASDGAMRARGRLEMPDGTRIQVSVRRRSDGREVGRTQVALQAGGHFDTPPLRGPATAPTDDYRFEISVQFNRIWQPEQVLARTRSGLELSGPGMKRGAHGEAIFSLTTDARL